MYETMTAQGRNTFSAGPAPGHKRDLLREGSFKPPPVLSAEDESLQDVKKISPTLQQPQSAITSSPLPPDFMLIKRKWHYLEGVFLESNAEPRQGMAESVVEFRFANYFQDEMVLQRGEPGSEIWGFGEVGQNVVVTFAGQTLAASVNGSGVWGVRLPSMEAGGPYEISASSSMKNLTVDIKIESVLFGDVWLCSGQSNMEFSVEWMFNGSQEVRGASSYPTIRFIEIMQSRSHVPLKEPLIRQEWSSPDSDKLKEFSGICWAFGRRLQERLHIPIGLIGAYYGNSPIKAWSSSEVMDDCRDHTGNTDWNYGLGGAKGDRTVLWNAMIAALLPLEIKGVLWYQGESDANVNFVGFLCMFPVMIKSWRTHFRRPNLPFGFVQLACRDDEPGIATPEIRWHQTADLGVVPNELLPNTFMAVALDLSDPGAPLGQHHPRHKEEIAERLFFGALNVAYNIATPFQGPSPASVRSSNGHATITFINGPIILRSNLSSAFDVCCQGGATAGTNFRWEDCPEWKPVTIISTTDVDLTLDTSVCRQFTLQFIRYAWQTTPCPYLQCALYGADTALPAGPFVAPVTN
ncbi:Sialate O-acetylesterase [Hypsibius exemplaris]|uniref:Sialate O-acetylesterase n=1 Tax=Hypsibius exemplaris TaxID=2072580 RepID=A0A1W0XA28_HYPEX|nr:Sialate O-acetylesterase [Hypsibius exemplaris]